MDNNKIKVLGLDEKLYEVSDFIKEGKTLSDAVGITFHSNLIGTRVLALESFFGEFSNRSCLVKVSSLPQEIQITCGLYNTLEIKKGSKYFNSSAAEICLNYKKGGLNWYLPSLLELCVLFTNRELINSSMTDLGVKDDYLLPSRYYSKQKESFILSSSESNYESCFGVLFLSGAICTRSKDKDSIVRPIAVLEEESKNTNLCSKVSDEELMTILHKRGYTGKITKTFTI